jgi:xylulokinase
MPDFFLGLDVGTSGTKAVLIDSDGALRASVSEGYPLHIPRPLWSEQEPDDWWQAATSAIRRAVDEAKVEPTDVAAVGLTGQMHGLVLLDGAGQVIRRAILWNDQRTAAQCERITNQIGPDELLRRLGNPVLPGFTAPKIAWVRDEEPEAFARARHVLLPKDFVRFKLTGEHACDVSDASGTALFNVRERKWDTELLDELDIPRAWMPSVFESPEVSAVISSEGSVATGLAAGTPVIAGAGDQAAQAVGSGIVDEGTISVTLGTSGVVFAASDEYRVEPEGRLHAFCHAVPGKWHLMGVMLSAAGSFEWFASKLGDPEDPDNYEKLTREAATVPAGSEQLIFLPYLSGERTPHADPSARGVFFGLTLAHSKAHMTRSVLEGVSFGLTDSLTLMRNLGIDADDLRISGGGARSGLWLQILANCFGTPVRAVNPGEGAAFGAALLSAVGGGAFSSVEEAGRQIRPKGDLVYPNDDADEYARAYARFRALYPAVKSLY